MPTQSFKVIDSDISIDQLKEEFAKLQKILRWLLNGSLDFENIVARGIKAENIEAKTITANEISAETITANELAANSITTEKLQAGAVTADKITVAELSAISADLGHITAGLIEAVTIIGSLIRTAGAYPRCEMSSTGNLFGAYTDANNSITMLPDYGGAPAILFNVLGSAVASMNTVLGNLLIEALGGRDLDLDAQSGGKVTISNWNQLKSRTTGETLQSALNSKANVSSVNSTISVITSVDFVNQTTTTLDITIADGVITGLA